MMYLQVAAGLAVLLLGGDLLVRGAVATSEHLGVSPLLIGLTVVAFGTSAPELVVCVDAVLSGAPSLAIGNVVGSNIANVLMVLGASALVYPVVCNPDGLRRDGALMVGASVLFVVICWGRELGPWHGSLLVALLLAFLVSSYFRAQREGNRTAAEYSHEFEGIEAMPRAIWLSLVFIVAGCGGLVLGSDWLVDGATAIARAVGVSEAVIGLTLMAIGTSLPELATSMVAAVRRHGAVALGNVVGSNMFNILGIMGVSTIAAPVPVPTQILVFDLWIMLAVALVLGIFAWRCAPIGRATGLVFAVAYVAYVTAQFHGVSGLVSGAG